MNHATASVEVLATLLKRNQRDPNCTGEGNCHGCLCWCDNCGEVSEVCDDKRLCDTHRPMDCCGKSPRGCECR